MKPFLSILLSVWLLGALAQERSLLPKAQLVVSRDTILIGEPVLISYQLETEEGNKPLFSGELNLPYLEILRTSDTSWIDNKQSRIYARLWSVTSFDTGRQIIPAQTWQLGGQNYLTQSDTLYVQYSLKQAPLQYHDLKDILEMKPQPSNWKWVLLALLGMLIGWIGYRFFKSKKQVPIQVSSPEIPALSPLESAQQSIQALLNDHPHLPADQWYLALTQIWHRYLSGTSGYPLGELTSVHIDELLQQRLIPTADRAVIEALFEKASLSKFAQYPVDEADLQTDARLLAHWLQTQDPLFQPPKSVL